MFFLWPANSFTKVSDGSLNQFHFSFPFFPFSFFLAIIIIFINSSPSSVRALLWMGYSCNFVNLIRTWMGVNDCVVGHLEFNLNGFRTRLTLNFKDKSKVSYSLLWSKSGVIFNGSKSASFGTPLLPHLLSVYACLYRVVHANRFLMLCLFLSILYNICLKIQEIWKIRETCMTRCFLL